MKNPFLLAFLLFNGFFGLACVTTGHGGKTEVCVLGMIHGDHVDSQRWGLPQVRDALRALEPDAVLAEIPPDRYPQAAREFSAAGRIDEPRVKRFPEYTGVLFPLQEELGYEIVPCAAWTEPMADDRKAKLARWKMIRPGDSEAVEAGMGSIDARLEEFGFLDDPLLIHTDTYDEIVEEGLEPYDRLFNDDLGLGGWTNINAAHWALLEQAIEDRPGQRLVITFGGWHKYWFLQRLREREDVVLLDAKEFLPR